MNGLRYMLDTNICIYIIKKHPASILKKFLSFSPGDIAISSITVCELYYGVYKSQHIEKNSLALQNFLLPLEIEAFDENSATHYGKIRAALEKNGTTIGALDLMIAVHAVSLDIPLVTNNAKEFLRVPDLRVENWVE